MVAVSFWYLDAFFLSVERCYRRKYEWIIENRKNGNMESLLDMNPYDELTCGKKENVIGIMFTKTLIPFYLLFIIGITIISLLIDGTIVA
jgi:hypothetical protein